MHPLIVFILTSAGWYIAARLIYGSWPWEWWKTWHSTASQARELSAIHDALAHGVEARMKAARGVLDVHVVLDMVCGDEGNPGIKLFINEADADAEEVRLLASDPLDGMYMVIRDKTTLQLES